MARVYLRYDGPRTVSALPQSPRERQTQCIIQPFDGRPAADLSYGKDAVTGGAGSVPWNLISRNGQKIVSGIYLFSVDTDLGRKVGRFVIIR